MTNKIKSAVIKKHEGDGFWQPGDTKGNCITIKVSPWNLPHTKHTVFMHELPKGGTIGEHAHQDGEEIFICLEGEAVITLDGKDFLFSQHDVVYIAPFTNHKMLATSEIPLKFMVVISPTGLEERLKLMGRERKSLYEPAPEPFETDLGKQDSHGVIKS